MSVVWCDHIPCTCLDRDGDPGLGERSVNILGPCPPKLEPGVHRTFLKALPGMRSALIFSAAAVASAVAPPRIELDLSAMSNAYKLASSIERSHDLSYTQADGTTAVMSRQDWL